MSKKIGFVLLVKLMAEDGGGWWWSLFLVVVDDFFVLFFVKSHCYFACQRRQLLDVLQE